MYNKALIPLDGTPEAEGAFQAVKDELSPECEIVLLHVLQPGRIQTVDGGGFMGSTHQVEQERRKMNLYLRGAVLRMRGNPERWRCIVNIAESVPDGIVECARVEGADLIAMFAHERKGLGRLLGGASTAREVQRNADCKVRLCGAAELATPKP